MNFSHHRRHTPRYEDGAPYDSHVERAHDARRAFPSRDASETSHPRFQNRK